MIVASSTRTYGRPATALLSVLGVVAALFTGLAVLAPSAHAATIYVGPTFGPAASVSGVGPPDSNSPTISNCAAGSVVTSVVADQESRGWLYGVEPSCSPVVGNTAAVKLGSPVAITPLQGTPPATGPSPTSSCPAGSVAVGIEGHGGALADAVGLVCDQLNSDGTLAGAPVSAGIVGGTGGSPEGPFLCKPGNVVVGMNGRLGQDITDVGVECALMTFTPQVQLPSNTSWPHARLISGASTTSDQAIDTPGEELWYAFPVQPDSQVHITLTGLTNDLDVAVFKDISQSFTQLTSTQDLTHLSAEFAGDAFAPSVFSPSVFSPSVFSPSVFSPSVFSPSVFSPSVFSPSVFSPSVFSPSVFSPSVFSPSVFSPSVFSPSVFSPSVFSPSVFSPSVFSPSVFSPSVFSPSVFSPAVSLPSVFSPSVFSGGTPDQSTLAQAFSSAQIRSLVGVSANPGTADESVNAETWNNTGNYYVRVTGRNGAISPFSLRVATTGGPCGTTVLADHASDTTLHGAAGPTTVVLTDPNRMTGTAAAKAALSTAVSNFATQVGGAVVNVDNSPKVQALDAQADANAGCPYAKNLVAQSIRDIVNSYRGPALKYVVIIGGDSVIPFFRYADTAGLGPENGYYPPVADPSASQASLRSNDMLSQDAYGAAVDVSLKGTTLPVPDLAVGRLVETPAEITATLTRYASTPVIHPQSTLSTGYDFLADAATQVAGDFAAGDPSGRNDTLITNSGVPPTVTTVGGTPDPNHSWTATDLSNALLGRRHDVVFLAGHFSANSTLAADYATSLLTTDLASSTTDFTNSLVFSAGCHSGYNLVDSDGVPGVTLGLDWAQAFAQKGATLIGGSGYQYGDTDFVAYSEKLYAQLAHDLREGTGPVAVGSALVQAKQDYLATLTTVGGIDQKSLLESTLYGLPMQGVDFAGRVPAPAGPGSITLTPVTGDPGYTLGLQSALLNVSPSLTARTTSLNSGAVTASYLTGPDGVVSSPGAPTLPLASSDVTAPGQVLRGVGLRSANYTDTAGITPLSGAATTEQSTAHVPFTSPAFYPNRLASPNYFGALTGGSTLLNITPAQYRSDSGALTDTERRYSNLGFQLFYSANTSTYGDNTPALAAPPSISGVTATATSTAVNVSAHIVGDPSAGVQQVWVTYTGEHGSLHGHWRSVDLTQDTTDSTLWTGSIGVPSGDDPNDVRFLVQAVNGVGEVGIDDNLGTYYSTGVATGQAPATTPTNVTLDSGIATSGVNGSTLNVGATLKDASDQPISNALLTFSLGTSGVAATTDSSGHAALPMQLTGAGSYALTASFAGDATRTPSSSAPLSITVARQPTNLSLVRASDGSFVATLTGATGQPLAGQTITLVSGGPSNSVLAAAAAQTSGDGSAHFPAGAAASGFVTLTAYFGDPLTPVPGGTSNQQSPTFAPSHSAVLRPAVLRLTDSPAGTSNFGARVNFTLSVTTPSGSTAAPTGTVGFAVDGTSVATVALSGSSAAVATTALLPGAHVITATYSGDRNYPSTAATVNHSVTCTNSYTGTVKGSLSVSGSGKSFCFSNATIGGSLSVGSGAALAFVNSSVPNGSITAQSPGQVMVCGSRTGGAVTVKSAAGLVVVGDTGHSQCATNRISGTLVLQDDLRGVVAIGNTVLGVSTKNIGGPGPYPGDVTTVSGNHP